jgi:putative NADH-flavin reductase
MNLTVLGSTGHTGRLLLPQAIQRGHRVTAFTRRPDALEDPSTLRAVVHGDARDPEAAGRAIAGADAVIAIISARSRSGPHHVAAAAGTIVDAMRRHGVRRLVITSVYPIVAQTPRLPIAVLKAVFAAAYADVAAMERLVSASDLDWTIVRLNRLTNKPPRGVRTSSELLDKATAVTRADAAATLLDVVEDAALVRTAVNVSGT